MTAPIVRASWLRASSWARTVLAGMVLLGACGRSPHSTTVDPATPPPPPPASPTLPPASQGCRLPPGTGDGRRCPYDVATFVEPINNAIAQLQKEQPEIFDFSQCFGELSCLVVDRDRYIEGILRNLRQAELCAIFDGEEVAIKNTNDFSDQYAVISSANFSRWGIGAYRATCRPAWF